MVFNETTPEVIAEILQISLDNGDWHTPWVTNIELNELSNSKVAYGKCMLSKHNTYHNVEVKFNINANTIKIWKQTPREGKVDIYDYYAIYNLKQLGDIISQFNTDKD
jgi:hypothetical protein